MARPLAPEAPGPASSRRVRRMGCGACAALWALSLLAGLPTGAQAQLTDLREQARRTEHLGMAAGLELGLYVGEQVEGRASVVTPSPAFALRLWKAVVEVSLPLSVLRVDSFLDGRVRRVRPGNVWLGVSYLPDRICGLTRLTLGVGAPSARVDDPFEGLTLGLAEGLHGSWDSYLWRTDLLPLVLGYQSTLPLGERQLARLTGEGDVSVGLPGGGRDTQVGLQWAGALSVGRAVRFAAGVSATYWPTQRGDDFQSALSTSLFYAGRHTRVGARFVLNLDGPRGFSFGSSGVWGVQSAFVRSF